MEVLILFGLILLNGLFAMSEIALVTARRARLTALAEAGNDNARTALHLSEQPTRLLSTVQIGITSISVLNGILGEAAFSEPVANWLVSLGMLPRFAGATATAIVVVVITFASIVIGELVPKRLGQLAPERIAMVMARPMTWIARAASPFVKLLSISTDLLLTLLRVRHDTMPQMTEAEINEVLEEGSDAGVIEEQEHEMVRNVFRLDDRQIASLMTPRNEIEFLDVDQPLAENLNKIAQSTHSRFPLVKRGLEEVVGLVSTKELLGRFIRREGIDDLSKAATPATFVPESLTGLELLQTFRQSAEHTAMVIDEYGQTMGIVTVQDLMEAIAGEFKSHPSEEPWAIQREDGSWLMDGLITVDDLKARLNLGHLPDEEKQRYNTLSGMLMLLLARLPATGDIVHWDGWTFEIVDMDGKRIDKVLVQRKPEEAPDEFSEPTDARESRL
ncbi:hemolysin family protein [Thiomonas bhubaneswarensis]|uniref:Hemolysin or related protein, contains CBS domains n=1 Tax=Thiomonas bhubaneswarensis TaxID=339866 RepID=A0A0K6IB19_9BURK|nr:hemolysin family protein [Thiomonas bhubaneswarensis]CUB00223.1 Hemolysin or related protein, contains CBS domains [Thiomonas bhubaneswarensis]